MGLSVFFKKSNDKYFIAGTPKYLNENLLNKYKYLIEKEN